MEILNIQHTEDQKKAIELCKNLLEKHTLIPVVGAGFSFDTPTDNGGTVPSARDLHAKLFCYVEQYSGYSKKELEEIKEYNLSKLAETFWNIYDKVPEEGLRAFYDYIESNFQNISYQKDFQKAFLKVRWPYIFTLNYDSLIEDYSRDYYPVIPYNPINRHFSRDKINVYKLHGDAQKYVDTEDRRYFILSKDQYIDSMMDDQNQDMLNELLTAFDSKSILFLGCGLSEELDLLYSSRLAVRDKVKNIDSTQQSIIYISYEIDEDAAQSPFSSLKMDQLAQYGVTHIFRIFSEQQSMDFFDELSEISVKIPKPDVDAFLEKYSSMSFSSLEVENIACRDFLFQENLVWKSIDSHKIVVPGYCVNRFGLTEVVDFISDGEPLCFIAGNFFSGKTLFLIEVAKYFTSKKVYIFPSGVKLTDTQLRTLMEKTNALYCFDTKSLTTAQIKMICQENNLDHLKREKSNAVIVIDASDAPMYKYIFEARNVARKFRQFWVNSVFDDTEEPDFNKKIGAISLPPYIKDETLLDYIVHNQKELMLDSDVNNFFLEPQKELLSQNSKRRTKALIMLATEIRMPAKRGIQFEIDGAINELIACCHRLNGASVIEKDYSVYSGDSSGYEFVCNSKYWIVRALSAYAKLQKKSIDIISDAYKSIVQDYRRIYKDDNVKFYQNSEPYYFFDHIQTLFNQRWFPNASALVNKIYDKLLPVLSDSFQFLHQKAKGKLEIARVQIRHMDFSHAKDTLKEAHLNITRAIKLAEQIQNAKNIEETILHMTYTKGRILIEYSCISRNYIPQAVEACYKLYELQQSIPHDVYDFTTGTGGDKNSFKKFKNTLITDYKIRDYEDLDLDKMEFLLQRWMGKHFKLRKKKKEKK